MTVRQAKDKVLAEASIASVIGSYVKLKKIANEHVGLCAFHDERTPSFSVNEKKGIYKCFGCGASGDVIDFVMEYDKLAFVDALKKIASIENIFIELDENVKKETETLKNIKSINPDELASTLKCYHINNLFNYIAGLVGYDATLQAFAEKYYIGTARDGGTIFWQVDKYNRVRNAQKIVYDTTGHRRKDITPPVKRLYKAEDGYSPCFFGEHQLRSLQPGQLVALVESEKTAVICSLILPYIDGREVVYLASSGLNGLTEGKLEILRGIDVCLIPDLSFTSRATWGIVPMRKKVIDGKKKISEDGELETDYVSKAEIIRRQQCRVSFFDPYPTIKNGTDLADALVIAGSLAVEQ